MFRDCRGIFLQICHGQECVFIICVMATGTFVTYFVMVSLRVLNHQPHTAIQMLAETPPPPPPQLYMRVTVYDVGIGSNTLQYRVVV